MDRAKRQIDAAYAVIDETLDRCEGLACAIRDEAEREATAQRNVKQFRHPRRRKDDVTDVIPASELAR